MNTETLAATLRWMFDHSNMGIEPLDTSLEIILHDFQENLSPRQRNSWRRMARRLKNENYKIYGVKKEKG